MTADAMVKVFFELDADDWHASTSESLWAQRVDGGNPNLVQLQNTPFMAKGISYRDIVRCRISPDGGLDFSEVVSRSGHSTYRVIPAARDNVAFLSLIETLNGMGCYYESGTVHGRPLYAFDLPPTADVEVFYRMLEVGESNSDWVFEEGHYCPPAERISALQ